MSRRDVSFRESDEITLPKRVQFNTPRAGLTHAADTPTIYLSAITI